MRRLLLGLLLTLCFVPALQAQDDSRRLAPGQPVSGVIDADHLAQMYEFASATRYDAAAQLENTGESALSLTLIDAAGNAVKSLPPVAGGSTARLDWSAASGSTYYLVVFPTQALASSTGSFTLNVSAPPTGLIQFDLSWKAGARLSLEVRDPQGQTLHWRSLKTDDGGSFSGDSDPLDCSTFTPHPQRQTAAWDAGLSGSYEILVHYIDGCETSIPFTVSVRLGNQIFPALSASVKPDSTFVGGFVVGADGRGAINAQSGIVGSNETLTIPTADLVTAAQSLPPDGAAQGHVGSGQPFRSYRFDGQLGDLVSVTVRRTSGSLDTILALLDSNGNLVAVNDDASPNTTDSFIGGARLRHNGTYLVVVTRYAQLIGATEGDFELRVTRS